MTTPKKKLDPILTGASSPPHAAHDRVRVRPLDPKHEHEVTLVARRMRETLIEVLGPERGASMYTLEWLEERVRSHLRPEVYTAQVLMAEDEHGGIVGHTMVRLEEDADGETLGLVATTYVLPQARRAGVAEALLAAGEAWLIAKGASRLATNTSQTNWPLIRMYEKHGYTITFRAPELQMVQLSRAVAKRQRAADRGAVSRDEGG